jgi:hypothetical protein
MIKVTERDFGKEVLACELPVFGFKPVSLREEIEEIVS